MPSRLALGFNPVLTVSDAVRLGQKAETMGYESVWFHESLYQRDVFSYLSAVLLSTTKLRAGSGALNTFTRHPLTAAATFASLSETSGGRVIMGLASGKLSDHPEHRLQDISRLRDEAPPEGLRVREHREEILGGREAHIQGAFFTAENLQADFQAGAPSTSLHSLSIPEDAGLRRLSRRRCDTLARYCDARDALRRWSGTCGPERSPRPERSTRRRTCSPPSTRTVRRPGTS